MGCLGIFVCQVGLAFTILNWSPDHRIFLAVDFLWTPLVRSVRIVKCRPYFTVRICAIGSSRKVFIYSLTNNNGSEHAVYNPVKLHSRSEFGGAVSCALKGPMFGSDDIVISNNAASNQDSYTHCGNSYPLPPGYSLSGRNCTFYAGNSSFTPTDIEVFYETTT